MIKSAVGSGDSFLGGYIYGLIKDWNIEKCVDAGQKCAILSLQSERNISEEIKESTVL